MFMDICNPSESYGMIAIFEIWFLLISFSWDISYTKMRVSWEFNIYNLFKSFY